MIVTPGVTDDTPQTALDVNLFEKVLELRDGTPWVDPYTARNWEGFTYSPPPNTGPPQNPLPNSIVIRDVQIGNDIMFVTGSIDYLWVFNATTYYIRDGFFACCRLGKINDLSAWHMNICRAIQNTFNQNGAIPLAQAQIPTSDTTQPGGCYGMAISDGWNLQPSVTTYASPADGTTQIAQSVFCSIVGGYTTQLTAGTVIKGAIPVGGSAETSQLTYPIHQQYLAIPLDGVADGVTLDTIPTLLPTGTLQFLNATGTYNGANYAVFGEVAVVPVGDISISAKEAQAVTFRGAQAIPFLIGRDCWSANSKNYGAFVEGSFMDGLTGTLQPDANGGSAAFFYDISLTQNPALTDNQGLAEARLGSFVAVGWGYAYADPNNIFPGPDPPNTQRNPLVCIGQYITDNPALYGDARCLQNTIGTTCIARQTVATAEQKESADVMQGAYYTGVQQLSTTQTTDEMILLRLFVPQFDAGAKPWTDFSHITYHYTNPSLLNPELGLMPNPMPDVAVQIGPLISTNTDSFTWQTFPTTEERGFQNTSLSNTYIFGTPFARPDSQNIETPTGEQNWGPAYNNVPRFSEDIRGFCGSYSPVNSTDPLYETVRPFVLTYDTSNSSSIVPDYAQAEVGIWSVQATSSCFFDFGFNDANTPNEDSVIAEMIQYRDEYPLGLDVTPYVIGGVMNMAYDVDRNQWLLSISANRDGTQNNPAWFMAATSNLSRFAFFKTGGEKNPVLAEKNATTTPGGVAQTTSFMFANTAGGTDNFQAFTLGGNFGSADGVGGTAGTPGEGGNSGPIQLTQLDGPSGRKVIMWVDYLLFDGVDSLIATVVQELGLSVTVENVEWYKRKMISGDVLNMTTEEIEAWVQSQQAEYRKMLIDNERQGRVRKRRRQQSAIAHDLEEQIQGEFVVSEMDFLEGDFIERNLKNISAFPDQDEQLKNQIITDEQFNELDSLYGTPVPKKTTSLERKQKSEKVPESDAEDDQT
jgi:hypothetical protein|tara:strand:+ start:1042 stop:3981 length:2940 start_codon:yes stop_codon:yes gene_type:complete